MDVIAKLRIETFDQKKFVIGSLLVLTGIAMPKLISVQSLHIPTTLSHAIETNNELLVLIAALKLVALNSLRGFPHYIGAFFIAESIELPDPLPYSKLFKSAMVCIIIPPVYFLIGFIHQVHYDLGLPALTLILLLTLLGKSDYNYVSGWKKTMLIVVFLTAFQLLDIMPSLQRLPIGRGETSQDVKLIARFLEMDNALDTIAMVLFLIFAFMGTLLFLLVRNENNLRAMNELKEQNERILMDTRLRILENRTYLEMRHLVHDLKSPLTSAQALVGLVRMSSEQAHREKDVMYLDKVEASIDKMSHMISEILYENQQSPISTEEIVNAVLAQISISEYASLVHVKNKAPNAEITVNKIRFVRALINIIENSFYAVNKENGLISLNVDTTPNESGVLVRFIVSDNGKGIDPDMLSLIWEKGFSTRSSHGLGLRFVHSVITNSGGTIDIKSNIGEGTTATILLKAEDQKDEKS